jgi:hypothetical protein
MVLLCSLPRSPFHTLQACKGISSNCGTFHLQVVLKSPSNPHPQGFPRQKIKKGSFLSSSKLKGYLLFCVADRIICGISEEGRSHRGPLFSLCEENSPQRRKPLLHLLLAGLPEH